MMISIFFLQIYQICQPRCTLAWRSANIYGSHCTLYGSSSTIDYFNYLAPKLFDVRLVILLLT